MSEEQYDQIRGRFAAYIWSKERKPDKKLGLSFPSPMELAEQLDANGQWPEINYEGQVDGAWQPKDQVGRILRMAVVAYNPESELYGNATLKAAIHRALGYWVREMPMSPNWYHNDIHSPRILGWIMLIMGDEATQEELDGTLRYMERSHFGTHTGSNRASMASILIMKGVLTKNPEDVQRGREVLSEDFVVTTEEGFQADNSYQLHGPQQQFGNYGLGHAGKIMGWMHALSGTPLAFPEEKISLMRNFLIKGVSQTVWKGRMDISALGRQLFADMPRLKGEVVQTLLVSMLEADPEHADAYRKALMATDPDVSPKEQVTGNRNFWRSDYMIDRRPTYYASIKMHSLRTIGTESMNKENTSGAYLADGALYIYRHGREYEDIFPVWDWQSLPGVTNINSGRTYPSSVFSPRNKAEFVGVVSDGVDGAASMDYFLNDKIQNDRSKASIPVAFKKSAFFFDREIVCLGAGLSTELEHERHQLITTLNQCLLYGPVHAATDRESFRLEERREVEDLRWAWHDGVGYYFPEATTATVGGKTHKGAWNRVYNAGPKETVERDVFLCQIGHGRQPDNASYAYVLLPDMSREVMSAYASNPRAQILSNTPKLQAAQSGNLTMATFYERGVLELPNGNVLAADQPCMVMVRETDTEPEITVSDPTQKLESLKLAWNGQVITAELPQGGGQAGSSVALKP